LVINGSLQDIKGEREVRPRNAVNLQFKKTPILKKFREKSKKRSNFKQGTCKSQKSFERKGWT